MHGLTCACCGYRTLEPPRGGYAICPICFWADDPVQVDDPERPGGANAPSLREAQAAYRRLGAAEAAAQDKVRPVDLLQDERDPAWRPYDPERDAAEPGDLEEGVRLYWLTPREGFV